ncbi:unnamed protein product [Rotaria sp. Silwood1]|nr:unnamed protein product [Rotaria sp. Silwood1]CAF3810913.1 unnamed protein product [Rotaria sp. Silwood1]CAF3913328.1 unnamed protein product [Rotaria sp. Silwood1]CAF3931841.1 unnamed protein product [Rotaria sp. Silwood1]CAF4912200.1 unnamed protein product [Rotaria sp. Silwood1]
MMTISIVLLIVSLINLTCSQIPNPKRYQLTTTRDGYFQEHYSIDRNLNKASRKGYSYENNLLQLLRQDIYLPNHDITYTFKFYKSPTSCTATKCSPFDYIDHRSNLVETFGGENKKYDELIFDADCDGECLTWSKEYNNPAAEIILKNTLYIKKDNMIPIKHTSKIYNTKTGQLTMDLTDRFSNWNLNEIQDLEYNFPMDVNRCFNQ